MKVFLIDQIGNINNKYSFDLCNGLYKNGINVKLITNDCNNTEGLNVEFKKIFKSFGRRGKVKKLLQYINSWREIIKYIEIENIDILHVQWITFAPVDYYFLNMISKKRVKIVMTVHDILPFNKKIYDYHYHKKIYNKTDRIILQAKVNVDRIQQEFNLEKDKCKYIPHGHFISNVKTIDKHVARKALSIANNKKVFLFFGQIKKVKGLHILIQALSLAVKENKNIYLIIAGKVWKDNFAYYQDIIDKLNLKDYIRCDIKFIPDEDIGYYFCASDVIVLPYLEIYQSGVVQLAYAYSKPVIATDVGGLGEVVEQNITGVLVPKANKELLAKAIVSFSKESMDAIDKIGANGKKYAEKNFDWQNICKDVKELYNNVCM
ncbi:glycosyltransferase family 4 protein [Clostridium felsineum]|uniref:glycosyltransferase family 4 protein n=1 Tax=Clostridium felsineum TaxID=36839 RepID=UPI0009C82EA4|nr:glycosyltransferase family 4 protein [Clostridium felsineum]URZ14842.1 D-inositol-3-phosphate glycosyltransferase [Clostridium felsineum DSM 794]